MHSHGLTSSDRDGPLDLERMDGACEDAREPNASKLALRAVILRNIARPGHDDRRRWVIGEEPHAHCRGEHRTDLRLDYCDPGIRERHLLGAHESSEDALLHPRLEPVDTTDDVDVFARGGDAVLRDGHTSNLDVEIALLRAQGGLFSLRQLR